MIRAIRLAAPTAGTAALRLSQLAALIAIARLSDGDVQSFLVTGFGLLAAFAIVSDAGGAAYLLSLPSERHGVGTYWRTLALQGGIALIGQLALVTYLSTLTPSGLGTPYFWLVVAIGLSQAMDGIARSAKAPLLVQRKDHLFALPDLFTGAAKFGVVLAALASGQLVVLAAISLVSLVGLAATALTVSHTLPRRAPEERLVRRTLEIGAAGALSALYSQSPMLYASALLPLEVSAIFAIIYRVVQALELLPSTFSTQLIPRLRDQNHLVAHYLSFLGVGAVLAAGVTLAWPVVANALTTAIPLEYALPVTLAFAVKCGNYALVAYLLGSQLIRQRLIVALVTGVVALTVVPALIASSGGTGLAASAIVIELAFTAVVLLILRLRRRTFTQEEV